MACNNNSGKATETKIDTSTDSTRTPSLIKSKDFFGIDSSEYSISKGKIKSGETFSIILSKEGVPYQRILDAVSKSKPIFNVRDIREGKNYYCFKNNDSTNTLAYFIYQQNRTHYIKYTFEDSIRVSSEQITVRIDTSKAQGVISSSLWISMQKAGVDPRLSMALADIYAWTIDFYGLQKGDSFNIIYQRRFIDTNYIGIGKIIASDFKNGNHHYYAYLFEQDSLEDYFDSEGGSLRRAFLKAPLKFKRISSRFSESRYHPILKIRRPHHGVDYAAPRGTPVHTIGDGKVVFIGRKGGYGNRIEIKHNSTYSTGYAHLSKFAKGLKRGDFVKQGTTIGYVGSTGVATGPHLDFRVYKNGKPIDPLKMKSPPAIPINLKNKANFAAKVKADNTLLN